MSLKTHIKNIADIWWQETVAIFKDSGAVLFCIVLPLAYPILYSWIYNNEVVREVPVVVVDDSHTMFWNIHEVHSAGTYQVAIFCDGQMIGSKSFAVM